MIVVFVVFALGLLNYVLVPWATNKVDSLMLKKIILVCSNALLILALSFFYGFRSINVGTDTLSYNNIFYDIKQNFYFGVKFYEPLYVLLNVFCYSICGDFNFFLTIVGLIIFTNTIISINAISKNKLISYFCFVGIGFYFQSFNIIRQWLALSFILVGLIFLLKKNKDYLFVVFVLIAFCFHKSALIAGVFLLFRNIKFEYKTFLFFLIGSSILIFLVDLLIVNLRLFPQFAQPSSIEYEYLPSLPFFA